MPSNLQGIRAMFNAFHHLPPDAARHVLADAASAGRPIAVCEFVRRKPLVLAAMLPMPAIVLEAVWLMRPLRPAWIFWSWVVPVIPAFVLFDGRVSCLRIYERGDLAQLTAGLPSAPGWRWIVGEWPLGFGLKGIFLHGAVEPRSDNGPIRLAAATDRPWS